jgi:predicted Zn-dependent peptidase
MTNLREDKGYTYGVGGGISQFLHGGFFCISTEVGAAVTENAVKEIFREIAILRETLVGEGELQTVKNYLLGQILRSTDGALNAMERFKSFHQFDLTASDFHRWIEEINGVEPAMLKEMAEKWLEEDKMTTVIAGAVT